jgi:hypothetical protein
MDDKKVDTLRLCQACGGNMSGDCMWCTGGFQNPKQQAKWNLFRQKMKNISGTYEFLQEIVQDMIKRLRENGYVKESLEGQELLIKWGIADADERNAITEKLLKFNKAALDKLMK